MTNNEYNMIYREALIQYRMRSNGYFNFGLCWAIHAALDYLGELSAKPDPYSCMKDYPHIYKYYQKEDEDGYWFPLKDTETRIRILEEAIKATE